MHTIKLIKSYIEVNNLTNFNKIKLTLAKNFNELNLTSDWWNFVQDQMYCWNDFVTDILSYGSRLVIFKKFGLFRESEKITLIEYLKLKNIIWHDF